MKILCTADYHISNWIDLFQIKENIQSIPDDYDIIVIAGDLFEHSFWKLNNPEKTLRLLYPEKIIIFSLGNHEFVQEEYFYVLNAFRSKDERIHCLDIEGRVEIGGYNFLGNAFWYDDSMSKYSTKSDYEFKEKFFSDYLFNPRKQHDYCRKQIEANYVPSKKNILITHTCPHFLLNGRLDTGEGANSYSGSTNFLEKMNFSYSICGHTHVAAKATVNGCEAINIGSGKEEFRYKFITIS